MAYILVPFVLPHEGSHQMLLKLMHLKTILEISTLRSTWSEIKASNYLESCVQANMMFSHGDEG